jgi:prepilin-type N-terminal cleavage/methylation domain-containing protein
MRPIPQSRKPYQREGFTFVEIIVAMAVLVLFSASALTALTQYNRYATASRLRAHALALAQQRIDEVLTTPWRYNATRPALLTVGAHTDNNLVLNADDKNNQTALKSTFTSLAAPVTSTRVTQITDLTTRTLRADVTVTFVYAGRTYTISLTTIRASDNV